VLYGFSLSGGIAGNTYFGGRVNWSKKVLDKGNNPLFIIRYRLGQCPRDAAEEQNISKKKGSKLKKLSSSMVK
jgi:hypothetical protein